MAEYEMEVSMRVRVAASSYLEATGRANRVGQFLAVISPRLAEHGVVMEVEPLRLPRLVGRETLPRAISEPAE